MPRPIFIYCSWRTASTWVWKKFRDCHAAYAYCEVYHEVLADVTLDAITTMTPQNWKTKSNHPDSAPYFLEFTPLFQPGTPGLPGMTNDLVLERMFPVAASPLGEPEATYLKRLIALADSSGKTPVITCTRNLGRAPATRLSFPEGVHIATVRNLWHQWMSFANQHHQGNDYFLSRIDAILRAVPPGDPFLDHLRERFRPADDLRAGAMPSERLLYAFVALHLHLYARALAAADLIIDINRLADDVPYRDETQARTRELTGLPVDFADVSCRIEYAPTPIPSGEDLRANIEPLYTLALTTAGLAIASPVALRLRELLDAFYREAAAYDFHTRSLRTEHRDLTRKFAAASEELARTTATLRLRDDELAALSRDAAEERARATATLRLRDDELAALSRDAAEERSRLAERANQFETTVVNLTAALAAKDPQLLSRDAEIARLRSLIYAKPASAHLYRAWKVLVGDPHYRQPIGRPDNSRQ